MRTGAQHDLYEYSAIVDRPPLRWPAGARIAVLLMPNIEHFEIRDSKGRIDVKEFAVTDYGNRVGVWRMLDALDRRGLTSSIALNASVCHHYPAIVDACVERGDEFIGHGLTNSEDLDELSDEESDAAVRLSVETLESATGRPVRGWLGPGMAETDGTLDALVENGVEYVCDWGLADDQPFRMRNGLYVMPYSVDLNDKRHFARQGTSADFYQSIRDTFDVLYREGEEQGRVLCLSLHPFLMGAPTRITYLERALDYIGGHADVWWARGADILDAYRAATGEEATTNGRST